MTSASKSPHLSAAACRISAPVTIVGRAPGGLNGRPELEEPVCTALAELRGCRGRRLLDFPA